MKELELYNNYYYNDIEEWFNTKVKIDPNMEWNELGEDIIGKGFIIIEENRLTYSFIYYGYNSKYGGSYKLIYKE